MEVGRQHGLDHGRGHHVGHGGVDDVHRHREDDGGVVLSRDAVQGLEISQLQLKT